MRQNETLVFTSEKNNDIPPWKLLENALKAMAILSQHEKMLSDYEILKQNVQ